MKFTLSILALAATLVAAAPKAEPKSEANNLEKRQYYIGTCQPNIGSAQFTVCKWPYPGGGFGYNECDPNAVCTNTGNVCEYLYLNEYANCT